MSLALALLSVLGSTTNLGCQNDEPVAVRDFSFVTNIGESVLHENFDRRRLAVGFDQLTLAFHASNRDVSV